jgi:hypothetical protein
MDAGFTLVNANALVTVSGRVANNAGQGLPNVRVTLTGVGGARNFITAADGNYQFTAVVGGNFALTAARLGFAFAPARITLENLTGDSLNNDFTGAPVVTPVPTPTPDDEFGGEGRDPDRWSLGVISERPERFDPQISVTQGANDPDFPNRLRIRPRGGVDGASFSGYVSARPIDFSAQNIVRVRAVRPATGANAATTFSVGSDSNNFMRIIVTAAPLSNFGIETEGPNRPQVLNLPQEGGQMIVFQNTVNGQQTAAVQPYNMQQQQFWRYRYDAVSQVLFFETSPDNVNWVIQLQANLSAATSDGLVSELVAGTFDSTLNPGLAAFGSYAVAPPQGLNFTPTSYTVNENGGTASVTVERTGNTETQARVQFATADGTALAGQDYAATSGTLLFGVGETRQTISIPILDDALFEPGANETFTVTLTNAAGAVIGANATATVGILDNETGANIIDDPVFFVAQQYGDFLGRAPDTAGQNYWVGQITGCGANAACVSRRRLDVSAAFFFSLEFFGSTTPNVNEPGTGGFVDRFYRVSFTRNPSFAEFNNDLRTIAPGPTDPASVVEQRRRNFADAWVLRPEFRQRYDSLNSVGYVDALFANAGVAPSVNEREFLVSSLINQTATRAQVLRRVSDLALLDGGYQSRHRNRLLVLMQYFGYLRRDPDTAGFNFWLDNVNRTNNIPGMVCAFVTSAEYQRRFGTAVTRTNAECANVSAPGREK